MTRISAAVESAADEHRVTLTTNGNSKALEIAAREGGGSLVNGGELLCLAIATCFCNDLYREAAKRSIEVLGVEVQADADFGGEGEGARRLAYRVVVRARGEEAAIRALALHTDTVAEIHNTLRTGMEVKLESVEVRPA